MCLRCVTEHACLLVVLPKIKYYGFFDPDKGEAMLESRNTTTKLTVNFYELVYDPALNLIPGYLPDRLRSRPAPVSMITARQKPGRELQPRQERKYKKQSTTYKGSVKKKPLKPTDIPKPKGPLTPHGLCAPLCFLVMMCCRRFNYHNPWLMAHMSSHGRTTWPPP